MGSRTLTVTGILALILLAGGIHANSPVSNSTIAQSIPSQKIEFTEQLANTPLVFTENLGQWDERVRFRADAGGATMWFTQEGAYYHFMRRGPNEDAELKRSLLLTGDRPSPDLTAKYETMLIKASFVGANPRPSITGKNLVEYKRNYLLGNDQSKWVVNVPNYEAVVYEDIYADIDLKYYARNGQMEYDFIVGPGADPSQILVQYEGAKDLRVNDRGELVVETDWGEITEHRPLVYQVVNGVREVIDCQYALIDDCVFGFHMPFGYNIELAIVIDPVLSYGTYLGGADFDLGVSVAFDAEGNMYLAGSTFSADFPVLAPYQTYQGDADHFVTKINSSGSSLIYSTYVGGVGYDELQAIAVGNDGCVYMTGLTRSTDYPLEHPYQSYGGASDAFVTKLNANGDSLVYSTYLGGTAEDKAWDIAIDSEGNGYVTGGTESDDFPLSGPIQTDQIGQDAFVTKLSGTGGLIYSTYLGSSGSDAAISVAVDLDGNAYVCGKSDSADFPLVNTMQGFQGVTDVFVAKINNVGNSLVFSTFLGGTDDDRATGLAIDSGNNVYLCGNTYSEDFPLSNPYQTDQPGKDAFVVKLDSSGASLVYSTYLGSSGDDAAADIAVDGYRNAYVLGYPRDADFPELDSYQPYQAHNDIFVTKLSVSGTTLVYSSFMGGTNSQTALSIAVDDFGHAYVGGFTISTDFPVENPYQPANAGMVDAFLFTFFSPIDRDEDGIADLIDNCPDIYNPGQEDWDSDGVGDSCDNCIWEPNSDQADSDQNGTGDVCEPCCLAPTVGDVDQSGVVDITDIQMMVDNQFISLTPLLCKEEGDLDFSHIVDISDLQILIDNQFLTLSPLMPCP